MELMTLLILKSAVRSRAMRPTSTPKEGRPAGGAIRVLSEDGLEGRSVERLLGW